MLTVRDGDTFPPFDIPVVVFCDKPNHVQFQFAIVPTSLICCTESHEQVLSLYFKSRNSFGNETELFCEGIRTTFCTMYPSEYRSYSCVPSSFSQCSTKYRRPILSSTALTTGFAPPQLHCSLSSPLNHCFNYPKALHRSIKIIAFFCHGYCD